MKKIVFSILFILGLVAIIGGYFAYQYYGYIYQPNVKEGTHTLYIASDHGFDEVAHSLLENGIIEQSNSFRWVAEQMTYTERVKAGKYEIKGGLSNRALVSQLRAGQQKPVSLVINNLRLPSDLAGRVAKQIEADSLSIIQLLNDNEYLSRYELDSVEVISMILPDTYEFYWNTTAESFLDKMYQEYQKFWNRERRQQAEALQLTAHQVSTLASIVQQEVYHNEEMDEVAGVYLNRLAAGWMLQADPTVKFAVGDFGLKRILFKHMEINHPYNTYKISGLPPGPICFPSKKALEAVLHPAQHQYMFFCAKEDFSMYHNFAKNLAEHNRNARKYQHELNKRGIY